MPVQTVLPILTFLGGVILTAWFDRYLERPMLSVPGQRSDWGPRTEPSGGFRPSPEIHPGCSG